MTQSIQIWSVLSGRVLVGRKPGLAENRPAAALPSAVVSLLRGGLVTGCVIAMGVAAWQGSPVEYLQADPALARLLRSMALIKGMIAIAIVGAVFWRLAASPVSKTAAAGYLACCWALAGSSMLIWQLSYIVPAALMFHAAVLSLLLLSWRER